MPRYTDRAVIEDMVARYEAGEALPSIGASHGVSRTAVLNAVKRAGVTLRKDRPAACGTSIAVARHRRRGETPMDLRCRVFEAARQARYRANRAAVRD